MKPTPLKRNNTSHAVRPSLSIKVTTSDNMTTSTCCTQPLHMRSPTQSQAMQKEIKHTSAGPASSKSSPFVCGLSNQSMRNIILEKISQLSAGTPSTSTFTFRIRYLTLAQVFPHSMQLTWANVSKIRASMQSLSVQPGREWWAKVKLHDA